MQPVIVALILILAGFAHPALADSNYDYQLYKNHENYGIVVFPKNRIFKELDSYLVSLPFEKADSGQAVMRHGSKNENATYMMPLDVQKKHSIEKFIVIQILSENGMLIGVYDPEWGLTLPSTIFQIEMVKKNIPKTLNVFRGRNRQRQTQFRLKIHPANLNFFSKPEYYIIPDEK